ncbi:MAG: NAD(P)/FAD-dependent oxidoreductase, partial [Gammaproteobacteria bacterium]|nr:NAD(P)/FAD-dependent oxidoreductase [Gammaproteobacteria bacterium]
KIGITGVLTPDFNMAWQHQKDTVATVRDSYLNYMKRLGIDFIEGHGQIVNNDATSHKTVLVNNSGQSGQTLTAKNVILATGSAPNLPRLFDISSNRIITTDTLFDQQPPPGDHVAIIGGGVIATEFAFILQALGKNIHWYSRSPILSRSDFSPQAIKRLNEKLLSLSLYIEPEFPCSVLENGENLELNFNNNTSQKVDWILLATGRKPYTNGLGLENTSISLDSKGFIITDQYLQTSERNIFAIGDVRSEKMTANQAIADANVVVENIINNSQTSSDEIWIPQTIYSGLEMARIGLNEDQAENLEFEPAVGFSAFEASPCALGQSETDGYVRIISDMDSGEFLGGEIIGENAAELIHLMAMDNDKKTSLRSFAHFSVNHPSRAEEIVNATETLANKWGLNNIIFPKERN